NSVNSLEPHALSRDHTKVEVPKELAKVSMVNTSLKKLKHHLVGFDVVVKEITMAIAITKGSWGFEHTKACFKDEIILFVKALKDLFNIIESYIDDNFSEVQNIFHQMEQAMEQHILESKTFEVKMNQVLNENERLLEQVINKDIVNIIMNSSMDNLLDNSISNQSALSFDQLFELNELKAQSQEKDMSIKKLKVVNAYYSERAFETDLKQLYDLIKPVRIRSKEQCDGLINKVNLKSVKMSDLNACLQEKVLVITALKDELRKLKGKALVDNAVTKHTIDLEMLKNDEEPITLKLLNNMTAHSAYIKHTQEEATILRDLVER
ncbi:hypothetical protein Tco_0872630, partial [Tanacetum coccineum]